MRPVGNCKTSVRMIPMKNKNYNAQGTNLKLSNKIVKLDRRNATNRIRDVPVETDLPGEQLVYPPHQLGAGKSRS